ncbi:hypothetical protein LSAT2_004196 [Lamellibrachia satsuma]|nr:hypothetical protein LSAT2_004196 [Lamellibrachia satsuma]
MEKKAASRPLVETPAMAASESSCCSYFLVGKLTFLLLIIAPVPVSAVCRFGKIENGCVFNCNCQSDSKCNSSTGCESTRKITGKTVELLIKEGFSSMEALVDSEDLSYTKIPRGQQKLLIKAALPLQPQELSGSAAKNNMAATGVDGPAKAKQQVVMDWEDIYTCLMSDHHAVPVV